jgi:drug/metabolite transporter, DME family
VDRPAARTAPLLVVAAAVLWGTAGTAQELAPPQATPAVVAAIRSLAGGLLLCLIVAGWRGIRTLAAVVVRGRGPLAAAVGSMTLFQLSYFGGIRLAGVAVGTLVAIGSAPVWAGVFEAAVGRRPGRGWVLATALTVVGTALLVLPAGGVDGDGGGGPGIGVAAAATAGAAYAAYAIASKRLLGRGVDGTAAMAVAFVGSGVLLAPALAVAPVAWALTRGGAVALTWLSIFTIALAYTCFVAGLRSLDPPTATTLTLAEPLTATILAVVLVGERLGAAGATGAVLVTIGLAVAGRRSRATAAARSRGRVRDGG